MKKNTLIFIMVYTFIAVIALIYASILLTVATRKQVDEYVYCRVSTSEKTITTSVELKRIDYSKKSVGINFSKTYPIKECEIKIVYMNRQGKVTTTVNRTIKGEEAEWTDTRHDLPSTTYQGRATLVSVKVNNTGDIVKGVLLLLLPMGAVGIWTAVIIKRRKAKKSEE